MSTPSDLTSLLHYGARQATVDGREYYRVAVVLETAPDVPGGIRVYCPASAWDASVAGRLAARDAEIARLSDLLRQAQAAPLPAPAPAAPPSLLPTWGGGLPRAALPSELPCPECQAAGVLPPRPCTTVGGLGTHRHKAHGVVAETGAIARASRKVNRAARVAGAAETYACPCGETFPTKNERGGHQRWCATYRAERAAAEQRAAQERAASPLPPKLLTCRQCKREQPRDAFPVTPRAAGGVIYGQPCAVCRRANAEKAAALVTVPCPHCGATGPDGAPRWDSLAQRNGHISGCVRRRAAPAAEAAPQEAPVVTAPKTTKAPKATKAPAAEAARPPLAAPLPAA